MFKFLHTADIHLDSPLKGLEAHEDAPVEEIRGATRRAFENLIDFAIEESVNFVLIAGDLYDGDWKDYNTGLFFAGQMGKLEKAGVKVFIVSGNHDAASRLTKNMPLPGNVTMFPSGKPQSVKLDDHGVVIHGQSYSSRSVMDNLALQYPPHDSNEFNIGLLHTSLTGRAGHENYAPCSIDDLNSQGYDYWALGHVHKREVLSEDPMILFPGNIQGRHIRETGAKGATLVSVEDGRIVDVENLEFDVLRWSVCTVDVSESESKEDVYEQVRRALEKEQSRASDKPVAVRLQLVGRCFMHSDLHERSHHWREEFRGIAVGLGDVWLEKVKIQTDSKGDLEDIFGDDSPFAGLLQTFENLDLGEVELTSVVQELSNLKTKLPPELLGPDSVFEYTASDLAELKEGVKELLIAKLLQHGDEL
ncbi:MAG TPA: DNA repair exonuclease [Desulfopila sp.]|nr:DNA repair exonuclease [Desulfopila sp.]